MTIKSLVLFSLGLTLFTTLTDAAVLNSQELPDSIENCMSSGNCSVDKQSIHDANGVSAFRYTDNSFSGYLFRYDLQKPSAALDTWIVKDYEGNSPDINHNSNTPLSGSVWLQVAERYDSRNLFHEVTLYLKNVQPSNQALLPRFYQTNTLEFLLTNVGLQNAHTDKSLYLSSSAEGYDLTMETGDLQLDAPLLICLSNGCGIELQLNLIGMRFNPIGNEWITQFNADSRSLLYSERSFFNDNEEPFNSQRSFYVQPVPLLPSGWLLLSGLVMLFASRRQTKTI